MKLSMMINYVGDFPASAQQVVDLLSALVGGRVGDADDRVLVEAEPKLLLA